MKPQFGLIERHPLVPINAGCARQGGIRYLARDCPTLSSSRLAAFSRRFHRPGEAGANRGPGRRTVGTDSDARGGAALNGRAPPVAHNSLMAEYDGGRHSWVVATLAGDVFKGLPRWVPDAETRQKTFFERPVWHRCFTAVF